MSAVVRRTAGLMGRVNIATPCTAEKARVALQKCRCPVTIAAKKEMHVCCAGLGKGLAK